jgi:tRNA 2-thiouridine synthesizing protein A
MSEVTVDQVIDARGMACPGPLMSLIGAMRESEVGAVVEVWSSDVGSATGHPRVGRQSPPRAGRGRR